MLAKRLIGKRTVHQKKGQSLTCTWHHSIFHIWGLHVGVQVLTENMELDFREMNERDCSSQSPSKDPIQNSQNIEQSFPALAEYYKSLEPHVKRRYLEKISVVEFDPGTLRDARIDSECLPPIEAMDLFSYLGLDTSLYSKEQFKASKSLESFNFLGLGFITIIMFKESKYRTNMFWLERFDIVGDWMILSCPSG